MGFRKTVHSRTTGIRRMRDEPPRFLFLEINQRADIAITGVKTTETGIEGTGR